MMKEMDYKKLRLDVLDKLICSRMIECKDNRTDMIRQLELDDQEKYVRKTIIEKEGDNYLIGVDTARRDLMVQMGKLIETGDATISHFSFGRHYFLSKINIIENGMD